ncbi:MAG: hypothetical protein GY953_52160 [bacterium]|nr:hypothetical protein [bacterium]
MRIAVAIQLSVALVLSFVEAPFFHVHEQRSHEHDGLVAHTHLSTGRLSERAGIDADEGDSDARELDWFQLEETAPRALPIVLAASSATEVPRLPAERAEGQRPRIHDPPSRSSLHPRAPPA